jgi:hypothetical protein
MAGKMMHMAGAPPRRTLAEMIRDPNPLASEKPPEMIFGTAFPGIDLSVEQVISGPGAFGMYPLLEASSLSSNNNPLLRFVEEKPRSPMPCCLEKRSLRTPQIPQRLRRMPTS